MVFEMAKTNHRALSPYALEAIALLSSLIREARLEKKITAQELAERAGVSRGLIQRIEKADASCAVGTVFEVASLLGIPLFDSDVHALTEKRKSTQKALALMPKTVRKPTREADDDF